MLRQSRPEASNTQSRGALAGVRGPALCALLLGITVGALKPQTLYSVELAQVISGVVTLPSNLPMAVHDGRVFSLLIDAPAVLLHFGLNEDIVCRILTALMGGLSYLTMALLAFAFTSDRLAAFAAPIMAHHLLFAGDAHKYPVNYPVSTNDLGTNGLHFALLTLSLLVLKPRAGAFLLGVLPGIHASLALAVWLVTAIGMLYDRPTGRAVAREWRWTLAGLMVVAVAWVAHQQLGPTLPDGPQDADLRYARAFITTWDEHRAPLGVVNVIELIPALKVSLVFLAAATIALIVRPAIFSGVRFWLAGQVAMSMVAVGVTVADEFSSGWAPLTVSALMISRWLNLNSVVMPPLLVGWVFYWWKNRTPGSSKAARAMLHVRRATIGLLVVLVLARWFRADLRLWGDEKPVNDIARARPGVLLTAPGFPFAHLQLHTGRPILLDADFLDALLPYAPEGGPAAERILNDAYGVSLLGPGTWKQFDQVKALWESWDAADWRRLKRYGVTDVLVPADWNLQLSLVGEAGGVALYEITD